MMVEVVVDVIRHQRSPARQAKAPGWEWDPEQGAYVWWDGQMYTSRAADGRNVPLLPQLDEPANGAEWRVGPVEPARVPEKAPVDRSSSAFLAFSLALTAWLVLIGGVGLLVLNYAESDSGIFVVDGVLRPQYFWPVVLSGALGVASLFCALSALGKLDASPTVQLLPRQKAMAIAALAMVAIPPLVVLVMIGGSGDA